MKIDKTYTDAINFFCPDQERKDWTVQNIFKGLVPYSLFVPHCPKDKIIHQKKVQNKCSK